MQNIMSEQLTIALTKGRILKETLPLLASAGITPLDDVSSSRKLVFETSHPAVRLVIIRGSDVPTYVRHGAADMGGNVWEWNEQEILGSRGFRGGAWVLFLYRSYSQGRQEHRI